MAIGKEEREAVLRVLDNGILSGFQGNWSESFYGGNEVKALEVEWATYFGSKNAISCNSATSGLWMALSAIGLQPEDECIVSPYTMTCSASMPLHFKAKPVFADIESDYYCLDVKSVEERITSKTKAIIVVDLFGMPYDADAINKLAERKGKEYGHKIYVIEDAAQSIGATYKNKYAGTLGDIGVFSLNFHKHIHCGEGGIVVTNDDELAYKLRLVMNHAEAVLNDYVVKENNSDLGDYAFLVGMNLRMTEIQAAIAREQLKKLDGILKVIRKYENAFPEGLIKIRPECKHAFYRYAWQGEKLAEARYIIKSQNEITTIIAFDTPKEIEIKSKKALDIYYDYESSWENEENCTLIQKQHYITPIYQMPLFKQLGYDQNQCPVCEKVNENIVLAWLKDMP